MHNIVVFAVLVGAIAFVLGQGGYYQPNGQAGNMVGYPLDEYLRAKDVYMRARLSAERRSHFVGDIVGFGVLAVLYWFLSNKTGEIIG